MMKIAKCSLAPLGVTPGFAVCCLRGFVSPSFSHISGLTVENFGWEASEDTKERDGASLRGALAHLSPPSATTVFPKQFCSQTRAPMSS